MGGCSAFGCTNRYEKGIQLFSFPTDPSRKAKWEAAVKRLEKNDRPWHSTTGSRLCIDHFAADAFENVRADGKRKLRTNAVPTIFSHNITKTSRSKASIDKRSASTSHANQPTDKRAKISLDHSYINTSAPARHASNTKMVSCCVLGCKNRSTTHLEKKDRPSYHKFPADVRRKLQWAMRLNRQDDNGVIWMPTPGSRICSKHFSKDSYEWRPGYNSYILKPNAIPTVFDHIPRLKLQCRITNPNDVEIQFGSATSIVKPLASLLAAKPAAGANDPADHSYSQTSHEMSPNSSTGNVSEGEEMAGESAIGEKLGKKSKQSTSDAEVKLKAVTSTSAQASIVCSKPVNTTDNRNAATDNRSAATDNRNAATDNRNAATDNSSSRPTAMFAPSTVCSTAATTAGNRVMITTNSICTDTATSSIVYSKSANTVIRTRQAAKKAAKTAASPSASAKLSFKPGKAGTSTAAGTKQSTTLTITPLQNLLSFLKPVATKPDKDHAQGVKGPGTAAANIAAANIAAANTAATDTDAASTVSHRPTSANIGTVSSDHHYFPEKQSEKKYHAIAMSKWVHSCIGDANLEPPLLPTPTELALKSELRQMKEMYRKQKKQNTLLLNRIEQMFNPDQIAALQRNKPNGMCWSEDTLQKGYKLRDVCGSKGYKLLLSQGFPLPSIKTLQRKRHTTSVDNILHAVDLSENTVQLEQSPDNSCTE